jgi:predicted nucleotidyltransferase component of viral defense system
MILAESSSAGFGPDVVEKAIQLLGLLEAFRSHPYLKGRIALKGGTALNFFLFDLPRLSVDVDLNYVGSRDRGVMLAERPQIEQAIEAVLKREDFQVRNIPREHAGGKWRLTFPSALGETAELELDINFMLRIPLWPALDRDSRPIGSYRAAAVPVLDDHELAGGKLAALLSRQASRDLFDAHHFLTQIPFDREQLRLAFVVYGGINPRDWRTVRVEDVGFNVQEIRQRLTPLLREQDSKRVGSLRDWAHRLVEECRAGLRAVLPLESDEREFLDRLLDHGEIEPSLLTQDKGLIDRIRRHPGLEWKALNVRRYREQQVKNTHREEAP